MDSAYKWLGAVVAGVVILYFIMPRRMQELQRQIADSLDTPPPPPYQMRPTTGSDLIGTTPTLPTPTLGIKSRFDAPIISGDGLGLTVRT